MDRTPPNVEIIKEISNIIVKYPKELFSIYTLTNIIKNKYHSKIFVGLSYLKFSSYSELSNLLDLGNMFQIRHCIDEYIKLGIVTIVKKQTEKYKIICSFWKKKYPTSPFFPTFYTLTKDWLKISKELREGIESFWSFSINATVTKRVTVFEDHYNIVKKQLDLQNQRTKNSIGNCYECGCLISKYKKEVRDFKRYGETLICSLCHAKADTIKIRKWIKQN